MIIQTRQIYVLTQYLLTGIPVCIPSTIITYMVHLLIYSFEVIVFCSLTGTPRWISMVVYKFRVYDETWDETIMHPRWSQAISIYLWHFHINHLWCSMILPLSLHDQFCSYLLQFSERLFSPFLFLFLVDRLPRKCRGIKDIRIIILLY